MSATSLNFDNFPRLGAVVSIHCITVHVHESYSRSLSIHLASHCEVYCGGATSSSSYILTPESTSPATPLPSRCCPPCRNRVCMNDMTLDRTSGGASDSARPSSSGMTTPVARACAIVPGTTSSGAGGSGRSAGGAPDPLSRLERGRGGARVNSKCAPEPLASPGV